MKTWKLPAVLVALEVVLLFVFGRVPIDDYLLIWGLIFGFLAITAYSGLGFQMFGQGYMNSHVHRQQLYDNTLKQTLNMTEEKRELVIYFEDVLMILAAVINIGLSWYL